MNKSAKLPFIDYAVELDISWYTVKPPRYGLYVDFTVNLNWSHDHAPYVNLTVYTQWFKFEAGFYYIHHRDKT